LPIFDVLLPLGIVLATVIFMELAAGWIHKYIMHGPGWGWHRSHHEPTEGHVERNDLYAVVFAAFAILLFWLGSTYVPTLWWVGAGLCVYGVIYYCVHDGLVHKRWPFRYTPKTGYLRRIYDAHHLHHAVHDREGAVSFGFLFVSRREKLRQQLAESRQATKVASK